MSSDLEDFILGLKKDTKAQFNKYITFFNRLNKNINEVYSFGFSYSKIDNLYIKEIISRISQDATWYFTEYENSKKEEIRKKKIKLRNYGFKGKFGVYL